MHSRTISTGHRAPLFRRDRAGPELERASLALICVIGLAACDSSGSIASVDAAELSCTIPTRLIFDGGPGKDGIPSLDQPQLVEPSHASVAYLRETDRVIGIVVNGQAVAMPLNVGWWHEVVNLDFGDTRIVVSHCPLTGSSLAFDRTPAGGATFGVSGLLFQNNLIMYDRNRPESLWPQMARGARCGVRTGTDLAMLPVVEMTWRGWLALHPETRVVSAEGFLRDYRSYPYGSYDQLNNGQLLFPMEQLDTRRPIKERVLGVPDAGGKGVAFPYGALDAVGAAAAVHHDVDGGEPFVVFWDRWSQGAMAYRPRAGTQALTFSIRAGAIEDDQTGSAWGIDGKAIAGPLAGQRLEPVAEAYVAFWFAWAAFHPTTQLWTGAT
ncbi:MAG: DUF3179 domain-containing protein [Gemmatimonadetes bacterium]|nr:DUF3179 domain-containing protein [Gemmatimonadota bacterium]